MTVQALLQGSIEQMHTHKELGMSATYDSDPLYTNAAYQLVTLLPFLRL